MPKDKQVQTISLEMSQTFVDEMNKAFGVGEKWMNARNEYAANYIKKNAVGKTLVLGGAQHSGNYTPADAKTAEPEQPSNHDPGSLKLHPNLPKKPQPHNRSPDHPH